MMSLGHSGPEKNGPEGSGQVVTEEELGWIRKRDRMRLEEEGLGGSTGVDKWEREEAERG